MGTAVGPKYMLNTYMDPLGYFAPDFGFMVSVCSVFRSPEIWSMALLCLQWSFVVASTGRGLHPSSDMSGVPECTPIGRRHQFQ